MVKILLSETKIAVAFGMDLIFGDPKFIPHPVTGIGKLVSFLEKKLIHLKNQKLWGMVMNIAVVAIVSGLAYIASKFYFAELYFMYTVFATKSLSEEGIKIYKLLKLGVLEAARKKLSYLVTRNTENMDSKTVIRSTMETLSENITDAITAPLFYMIIGGLPLAMAYKAINTMDSMVGYKNEKYINFGWFSAKLDDIANFIPARITGGIIIPVAVFILKYDYKNSFKIFRRDRKNHESPNSAHTEAAVAGALGVQFGGKTEYFGKVYEKELIGDKLKEFEPDDIFKNVRIVYMSAVTGLIIMCAVSGLIKWLV